LNETDYYADFLTIKKQSDNTKAKEKSVQSFKCLIENGLSCDKLNKMNID